MTHTSHQLPLYLASTSPRREILLKNAGLPFKIISPTLDESKIQLPPTLTPTAVAQTLALLKTASVLPQITIGTIIAADTIIHHNNQIIGKPNSPNHARQILLQLFDSPHLVITAVALASPSSPNTLIFHDIATVTIQQPPTDQLNDYINSNNWQNKAGGYNLAELKNQWNFQITGDQTTIIGLPMTKLTNALKQFNNHNTEHLKQ